MPKTSSKSVSKAAPEKKVPAKTKRVATAAKKRATPAKKTKISDKKTTAPKKQATAKKKTATKRASTTAKVSRKTTGTKPAATKAVTKATASKTAHKRTTAKPTKSTAEKSTFKKSSEVTLPTRMSIRAREKALVLADMFERDFYAPGLTLAKAGGLCFLLLGSLATYSQLAQLELFEAQCLADSCNVAQVGSATDSTTSTTNQNNYVELLADIPDVIDVKVGIPIQFSTAENVKAYVRHLSGSGSIETRVALEPIGNNKFEAYIDPEKLDPNQYELMVSVQHTNDATPTVYSLGFFAILGENDRSDSEGEGVESVDSTTSNPLEPEDTPVSEPDLPEANSTASTTGTSSAANDFNKPVTYREAIPAEEEDEQPVNKETEQVKDKIVQESPLRISADLELQGIAEVSVSDTKRGEIIIFYIRPVQTLNTQSVGQLISGVRTFRFDTSQFPNGQYQLYAERQQNQTLTASNNITFAINNVTTAAQSASTETIATGTERQLFDVASDVQTPVRQPADDGIGGPAPEFSVQERARAVLATNPETLDGLFQRYAVAEQSGDPTLIAEAKMAIQNYRQRLLSQALNNERDRLFAKELEVSLGEELDVLMRKVQIFESIRKDRTKSDSATDTDGDGISDFDEVNLYNTNPDLADSDNDGFTDGAEIISGFNPNDATAEAAIEYESPKESVGVVTTQKLQVSEVVPEIELSSSDSANSVRAVVRGTGLPDSFVTLYVFSSPTIVTVRTESDGSFAYTFTKELEDGQHEVFVALTDNTGAIVAQSKAFTFIKEAQAFTPVDAEEVITALAASDSTDQTSPYQLVLGMSVFALGILLLLLGIGLRGNKPDIVVLEDKHV